MALSFILFPFSFLYSSEDRVFTAARQRMVEKDLREQLKDGGRLILPLGSTTYFQTLTLVTKKAGQADVQHLGGVAFAPMTGEAQKK